MILFEGDITTYEARAIELYAVNDIPDLSKYGIGLLIKLTTAVEVVKHLFYLVEIQLILETIMVSEYYNARF